MLATTARCILYNKSLTGLADKIFDQLLSAWEAFSAAERLKAEQDAEVFKSKTQETNIKTEEVFIFPNTFLSHMFSQQ